MNLVYFSIEEFNCQETGENEMEPRFLEMIDTLRQKCNFPFNITSGYRSPRHSIEAKKARPGQHAQGLAADIRVKDAMQRHKLVKTAMELGFTGIGVSKRFIHVDIRNSPSVLWLY
jgi:uncharacterized protein YcbK (DUF882 family)